MQHFDSRANVCAPEGAPSAGSIAQSWQVASVSAGMLLTIVFGLWLVADLDYVKWSNTWVILALIGWVLANALGSAGGRREKETRVLAERLASEGDAPSTELRARMRDPLTLALSWGSGVVVIAILALMIWKPGH